MHALSVSRVPSARPALAVLAVALLLAGVACNLNPAKIASPAAPCSVTTSKEAADRLIQRISEAAGHQGQQVTVTATSEEVSSLIKQSIDEAKAQDPQNTLQIESPVVCFTPGKMTVSGAVKPDGQNSVNALMAVSAGVQDGKVAVNVEQLQLGPLPVPQSLREQASAQINDALNRYLDRISLSDIRFEEGQMTLTGTVR